MIRPVRYLRGCTKPKPGDGRQSCRTVFVKSQDFRLVSSVSALFGQTTEPQANNGSGKTWDVKLGTVWLVFHPHNLSSLVFRSLVLRTRIIRPDFIDDFLHSQVCHKQTPRGMKWHCGAHGLPDQYSELRRPPHHLSLEIDSAGSCDRSAYRDFSVDPIGIAGTDCGVLINVSTQLDAEAAPALEPRSNVRTGG